MAQTKDQRDDIIAFTFCGIRHVVESGRDALRQICLMMLARDKEKFESLTWAIGYGEKCWFWRDTKKMNSPFHFPGTDIFLDLNLKTADITKIAEDVVQVFGFTAGDLKFEIRHSERSTSQ